MVRRHVHDYSCRAAVACAAAAVPAHAVHVKEFVGPQVLLPQRLTQQPARNIALVVYVMITYYCRAKQHDVCNTFWLGSFYIL
jgi:hypothetical protein